MLPQEDAALNEGIDSRVVFGGLEGPCADGGIPLLAPGTGDPMGMLEGVAAGGAAGHFCSSVTASQRHGVAGARAAV